MDVEGYELNALRGLNLGKYRPKYILVEMNDYGPVYEYLIESDYQQIDRLSYHDFLFKDKIS